MIVMIETTGQALKSTERRLKQAGIGSARLDALILLEQATGKHRSQLIAHPDVKLNTRSRIIFNGLVKRRVRHEPIAYILGYKEFYGLKFKVTSDVLIPRPETEAIVELALDINLKRVSLLDVGTGAGAIVVAIAKQRPAWKIVASDISAKALRIAKINANSNGVEVDYKRSDLLAAIESKLNIITANLPYVRDRAELSLEGQREPAVALFGGKDGLDIYRRLMAAVPKYLTTDGYLIIEADPRQHLALTQIAANNQLQLIRTQDYALAFRQHLERN